MHAVTITTSKQAVPVVVLVVGHHAGKAPRCVERAAARLAADEATVPLDVSDDGHEYLLVKPDERPWLVGGEVWRQLGAIIVAALRDRGHHRAQIRCSADREALTALVEGLVLADYRFDDLRGQARAKRKTLRLDLPGATVAVRDGVAAATIQNAMRRLADLPGNVLHPKTLVREVKALTRTTGLRVKVITGVKDLRAAGFPGLVQVGQAGSSPPALVELNYRPRGQVRAKAPRLALVGKGITFDSGGLSLKPGADMWKMKGDLGGAVAVLGAMLRIVREQPRLSVTGYLALAENLPDRKAQRPGDIYRTRKGITVHVENTDAEGRLVLADVLTYAGERGATHIVDAATLTGACLVALGNHIAGLMGNDADWEECVRQAGQATGEELWRLPLYGEYRELLEHPHADLNNIGGKFAGTIIGGLFLERFVADGVRWAHLDIAGPAMMAEKWRYYQKGNTGFGVRTLAAVARALGA